MADLKYMEKTVYDVSLGSDVYQVSVSLGGVAELMSGAGSPEGAVVAALGKLYLNTSGGSETTLYVKEAGDGLNTGWQPALTNADGITVITQDEGVEVDAAATTLNFVGAGVTATGGAGTTTITIPGHPTSAATWPMGVSASTGTVHTAGFYYLGATANDFNGAITFGTANGSYAAHFFVVTAAGATDTAVTITGTSITDTGTRTPSDTEVLSLTNAALGTYYETTKKWLGQVSIAKTAGTDRLCNYGFCKYWDNANTDFTLTGVEAIWAANKTDAAFNIIIHHHKATGWTYAAGGPAVPPTLNSMVLEHVTETSAIAGHDGAFKLTGLSTAIEGSGSEGLIFSVVTGQTLAIDQGSIQIWYTQ